MTYESEHGDLHSDLHSDHDPRSNLHEAFGAEVATLAIGASPIADVMRDGAARRTRRRLAVGSGVATLAVLPIAAVALFAGGGGAKGAVVSTVNTASTASTATSPTSSAKPTDSNPPPIIVPTPLPAPGTLNPALPNDSVVVLASGTVDGKQWRLVRDRYVVAGPESDNVMDDPASRPHLPYAANWDKPGTIECDFTGVQWGEGELGGRETGGSCGLTDKGSVAALTGRFDGGSYSSGTALEPGYLESRIDGTDVAYAVVTADSWSSGKLPIIKIPGERNAYIITQLSKAPANHGSLVVTLYDAHGRSLGSQQHVVTRTSGKDATPTTPAGHK